MPRLLPIESDLKFFLVVGGQNLFALLVAVIDLVIEQAVWQELNL